MKLSEYRAIVKAKKPSQKSKGEAHLAEDLNKAGIVYEREFHFARPAREWRSDFYIPEKNLLIEVEGGVYMKKSRHTSGKGYTEDLEKYNAATILHFSLLRYTTDQVVKGMAITQIKEFLCKS